MIKHILIVIIIITTLPIQAQKFDKLDKSPMDRVYYPENAAKRTFLKTPEKREAAKPKIRVTYSRPGKNGRKVFGKLLKFNKPWRIGANESTEIVFMTDVLFGNTTIKAGRYSLIIIPEATEWTLKLNTMLDGWGNYGYDSSRDIGSITVSIKTSKKEIEHLSMALYEKDINVIHLKIGWDTTVAEFPITLK